MRIGIDLGGTKIEGLAIDANGGERVRRRIAAPRGDYERTLDAVAGLVRDIEREIGGGGAGGGRPPPAPSPPPPRPGPPPTTQVLATATRPPAHPRRAR